MKSPLKELATLYDVQVTYEDAVGKRRDASRESLAAVLRARAGTDDLAEALRARRNALQQRVVEPVIVVWGGSNPAIPVRLPNGSAVWELHLEDGTSRGGVIGGAPFRLGRLPAGYHSLRVTAGSVTHESMVIASPMQAWAPQGHSWGVFAPLYAATTERSWGAGDLGDMQQWREWVNGLGGGVVATLPMLPLEAGNPSPYSPLTRLFWNEMYLDVERVPEFDRADREAAAIAALRQSEEVDYEGVMRAKRIALERMCDRFQPDDGYQAFTRCAMPYAEFLAKQEGRASERYHLYVQYRMAQQMREVADEAKGSGVGLYLDFPLGVNPSGYDASRYASSFMKRMSVGAPPDLFFTKGQNWGFAPLDPDAIREQRHLYFRAAIRHHASHAGVLRIDHVMGLHRLFWIPEGAEAKDGVYVKYPEDELYAILILESNRNRCAVVGEDLGTVPQYVPGTMKKHGLRRMYVVQYEVRPEAEEPAGTTPVASVASINTHDMPTFAAFWEAQDVDDRVEQRLLDAHGARDERRKRQEIRDAVTSFLTARGLLSGGGGEVKAVLEALLKFLAAGPAEIVLVNLEDLWQEQRPQNVPGVPARSWKNKFRFTLEEVRQNGEVNRILSEVNAMRREVNGKQT